MSRSHAQQFAHETLPRAVFGDPLALTRAIDSNEAAQFLNTVWEQAAAQLVPIARMPNPGCSATIERQGLYSMVMVTPPPPRVSGDPALIAVIGRGDGIGRLATLAYYVLDLVLDPRTGVPSFAMTARSGPDEKGARWSEGPLPDRFWFGATAYDLYNGQTPHPMTGIPQLPFWYWWHAFDGATAMRFFNDAKDEADRFQAVRSTPILLMPEIADAAEIFIDPAPANRLRELRPYLLRDQTLASAWQDLVQRLVTSVIGSVEANTLRALPLAIEAAQGGALAEAQGLELEASVRGKLAALGINADENRHLAEQLVNAARTPRSKAGSVPPPTNEDPVWSTLFLDETDLQQHVRGERDEATTSADPTFLGYGGVRAGYAVWLADESSSMARIVDTRWVFRTSVAALHFMRAVAPLLSSGLPPVPTPQLGDDVLAFGDQSVGNRRTYVIAVRVGRVVARLQATEGLYAAASRQVLHAATLHPLAHKIVQRARQGLAAYWIAVAYPTNAVPALLHSKGHDAAQLLEKYVFLAHPEMPGALAMLGDEYAPAAAALANFQAQVRAHRWVIYRKAMFRLVRTLLDTDMGDPRVNAAHAFEIVTELRYLDPDPVWIHLEMECRARG